MRLDVALGARIAVVEPGAADAGRLLQDHEVVVTPCEQAHAGADAAGPGADDRDTTRAPVGVVARVVCQSLSCVRAMAAVCRAVQ